MGDFLSRLSERALGVAPVVRPATASMFAPEPTSHAPGSEWEGEAPASPGDLEQLRAPSAREPAQHEDGGGAPATPRPTQRTPPSQPQPHHPAEPAPGRDDEAVSSSPLGLPEDSLSDSPAAPPLASPSVHGFSGQATSRPIKTFVERGRDASPPPRPSSGVQKGTTGSEARPRAPSAREAAQLEDGGGVPATQRPTQRTPPSQLEPDLSEPRVLSGREDQETLPAVGSPQRTRKSPVGQSHPSDSGSPGRRPSSEKEVRRDSSRPRTLHRAEPDATQRGAASTPQRVLPENPPVSAPTVEDESGPAVSHPIGSAVERGRGTRDAPRLSLDAQASLDVSESTPERFAPPDGPLPVAPRTVRPQPEGHLEREPREPGVAAPELPAPTIHVAIGRIEVRAVTPPPTLPARRATPVRPSPALSLDDYLERRNEGR